jgi:tRNA1(Val) A37 N6-methylase TrmN6
MNNQFELFELFTHNQIKLHISKNHRFGTDSLLLGEFACGGSKNKVVCDLCSGCGIIPILLDRPKKVYAVEIQEEAVNLINRTIKENNLGYIEAIHSDLRDCAIKRESIDLVTANPPYYPKNSGFERDTNSQKTARYESECTLADVVKAAARLLKFGGELKMSMTASRLAECIAIMQEHSIEPKEIIFIPSKKSDKMRLFLISGKKGAKSGVTVICR